VTGGIRQPQWRDPHDVLGVRPGAGRQEVIRAFRHQVRQGGHPDTGGDGQKFEDLVRARDILLDAAQTAEAGAGRRTARSAGDLRYPTETVRTGPTATPGEAYPPSSPSSGGWEDEPRVQVSSPQMGTSTSIAPIVAFFLILFIAPVFLRLLVLTIFALF
jgi:curved DNA-binding protein CbpA